MDPCGQTVYLQCVLHKGKRVEKPVKVHELSVLLVQIRDHGSVRDEEVESFIRHGDLEDSQLHVLNVFDTPSFLPSIVDPYDVVLVGGASEASVLDPETYRFVPPHHLAAPVLRDNRQTGVCIVFWFPSRRFRSWRHDCTRWRGF